ncbi:MAG TPA: efflux RND transporter periplasmic adaptor subunit [Bryobacteraceae bacterium]|jgi:RND family efflux transporter MFP subunit|nr:efflux RND transporter periplasmic adaptor subunit [Bryobacteraceae bacterium]
MRYSESDRPPTEFASSAEETLRRENEELRRQLQQLLAAHTATGHPGTGVPGRLWRPSSTTIWALGLFVMVLLVIAFFAGYLPLHRRSVVIADEARDRAQAVPRVPVVTVGKSSHDTSLQLPGNIQAVTEAPILARADGYIKQRLVDIGDRVHAGQTLAVIEAPELDEQVRQAQANLHQSHAAVDQANANLQEGRADLELARITAKRWANLVSDGSVSVQENDQYQAQYQSKIAAVHALEQAVAGTQGGVAAAEANLARLQNMKGYRVVEAPFDGVITLRNVDTGALVNNGNTLLFRIAQTEALRIYLNVPQTNASSVHRGDAASLTVSNQPGRTFSGIVARTANALDPASRTLLVEVHVPNPDRVLLPGMYAQVELSSSRSNPPLLIPSDALIISDQGTQVALVKPDHRVHLQPIVAGRDYGDRIEVMSGLHVGDAIVANPGDVLHEGTLVEPTNKSATGSQ